MTTNIDKNETNSSWLEREKADSKNMLFFFLEIIMHILVPMLVIGALTYIPTITTGIISVSIASLFYWKVYKRKKGK